jgi:hypothetical protein
MREYTKFQLRSFGRAVCAYGFATGALSTLVFIAMGIFGGFGVGFPAILAASCLVQALVCLAVSRALRRRGLILLLRNFRNKATTTFVIKSVVPNAGELGHVITLSDQYIGREFYPNWLIVLPAVLLAGGGALVMGLLGSVWIAASLAGVALLLLMLFPRLVGRARPAFRADTQDRLQSECLRLQDMVALRLFRWRSLPHVAVFQTTTLLWQDAVRRLMGLCQHAILVLSSTCVSENVAWELDLARQTLSPDRLLVILLWDGPAAQQWEQSLIRSNVRYINVKSEMRPAHLASWLLETPTT